MNRMIKISIHWTWKIYIQRLKRVNKGVSPRELIRVSLSRVKDNLFRQR